MTSLASAQPSAHPPTLTLDGTTAVPLAGQALRAHLLGEVDLYSVAVYVDGRISDLAHLSSPDVSKAVRIEIRYKDDLKRRLLLDWWRELGFSGALDRTTASVGETKQRLIGTV